MNNLRFLLVCFIFAFANGETILKKTAAGSWSDYEGDFVTKWEEILTKAIIKVDGFASDDLVALGTPQSASSQVVAGTNYKFAFADGTRVTVLEQVWMDPQITITNIDAPQILRQAAPGSWSSYEGDFVTKWGEILTKATIKVDGYASEDLVAFGTPQSASSQVVAGTNYKFAFSDGTLVTVLEQVWMDPQITITNIDKPQLILSQAKLPMFGGWSAYEGDFATKWSDIVDKGTIDVKGYGSEDLSELGVPKSASSQVTAGTNYKFTFKDGTLVTVLEQVWMEPQIRITNIDFAAKICPGSPQQLCRMLCPKPTCESKNQCAFRKGNCCDYECADPKPKKKGEVCGNMSSLKEEPFPKCETGLTCKATGTSDSEKKCWEPSEIEFAEEGELCEGLNEKTGEAFPKCKLGLVCKSSGKVSIPGSGKTCVKKEYAKVGETCEGFDESTGKPFPECEDGLACKETPNQISIPGAEKTCVNLKGMELEPKSCVLEDGEVVKSGWNGNGRGDNFCNKCGCHDGAYYCTEMFCGPIIAPIMECICPVGRRQLMINPDYFACEVEGYELTMETTKYPCPDGTTIDCGGPGYICQNSNGDIMDTISAPIDFECPQDPPIGLGGKCIGNAKCEYGEECCCGKCFPSEVYMCTGEEWVSYFTDACMMPECEMPILIPADEIKCCEKDVPQGWDEGGVCCSDGSWHADVGDGSTTCSDFELSDSSRCPSSEIQCCEQDIPQGWFEGGVCCGDGQWHADRGDGSTTCDDFGLASSAQCPSQQGLILHSTSNVSQRKTTTYILCVFFSIFLGVVAAKIYQTYCCIKIENKDFYTDLQADV